MDFENKDSQFDNLSLRGPETINRATSAHESNIDAAGTQVDKNLQIENTEDVIRYSHLIFEVNRLLRYASIIKQETKFLEKIKNILTVDEVLNAKLFETVMNGSPVVLDRIQTKVGYLKSVYDSVSNHQAFLLDYAIMYLGAVLENMKILKNLDYRRVLYVRNQVSKCKTIIMNSIREGCPNLCKKYKESKAYNPTQDVKYDEYERTLDNVMKKVKPF